MIIKEQQKDRTVDAGERQARKPEGEIMKTKKKKLKCKRLQKNEYIIFETGGRRIYLVHDRRRAKEIMHDYRKYGATPF